MTAAHSDSGLPQTDYFAPYFSIEVEGRELLPNRRGDVVSVKVTLGIQELGSCEITLANWDDETREFRAGLDIGSAVRVLMGYADQYTSVFHGQVTRIAPRFPDSGGPITTVTCLDGLVRLRDRQPADGENRRYENKADWEIAEQIAQRHGFGFTGTRSGPQHPVVWQKNQDDASFLMERASYIDFDCFVMREANAQRDTLFFVQPTDGRNATAMQEYTLEYQKNLTSFSPQVDLTDQVSEVTVRGWDHAAKEAISYTATRDDLPPSDGGGTSGPQAADQHLGQRAAQIVDAPVLSQAEARELAISILRDRAYKFVTAEGQMIGLPNLRPGHNLDITNVGQTFSGRYYVNACEHTIGEQGYVTTFKARRCYMGSGSGT